MSSLSDFREVMERVINERNTPVIDPVYQLEGAREAHARYERGEQLGEIVLKVR